MKAMQVALEALETCTVEALPVTVDGVTMIEATVWEAVQRAEKFLAAFNRAWPGEGNEP